MPSVLNQPFFQDEEAAYAKLESIVWPHGPVCPHCGSLSGKHYDLRKTRVGLRKCSDCRKQFTVKVGTVFECAKIPLHLMLQAVYLLCASKKGCSSHQIHRTLGITYKSAWFLTHRIREALRSGDLSPMGGEGEIVEVDETFIGIKEGATKRRGYAHKHAILSLVALHRGFDGLVLGGFEGRQDLGVDAEPDGSGGAGRARDEAAPFEGEHHLMDGGRRHPEVPL